MSLAAKILGLVLMPISAIIMLEAFGVFSLDIGYDKALICAGLLILLQVYSAISLHIGQKHLTAVNWLTFSIFTVVSLGYISGYLLSYEKAGTLAVVLASMALAESVYVLN